MVQAAGTVRVTYSAGGEGARVVEARKVILALPPRVVAGSLAFEPPLPADKASRMGADGLNCLQNWPHCLA